MSVALILALVAALALPKPARGRVRQRGEWPAVTVDRQPEDYTSDDPGGSDSARRACRGTVEYDSRIKSYGLHRVEIETTGPLTIRRTNFSYARLLITGPGPVTFLDCNLSFARYRSRDGAALVFAGGNTNGAQGE